MKLLSFSVSNFKSIGADGGKIDILPVTVLVGENGAGKSSILEALAFIAQRTRKKALGRYELSGEYISFSNINEILFRHKKDRSLIFEFIFELSKEDANVLTRFPLNLRLDSTDNFLGNMQKSGIPENDQSMVNLQDLLRLYQGLSKINETIARERIMRVKIEIDGNNGNPLSIVVTGNEFLLWAYRKQSTGVFAVDLPGEGTRLYLNVGSDKIPVFGPIFDTQRRSYIVGGRIRENIGEPLSQFTLPDSLNQVLDILPTTESWIISALARIFYLRAPRGHLISTVTADTSDQPLDWVGNSPVDLGRFLTRVFGEPSLQKFALPDIKRWAQEFRINAMNAASYGASELNLDYTDDKLVVDLGMKGLGYGSSQVLPIIAQGFASESESILAIEEPEISLHPNAQVRMLDMFTELVKNQKSIIFTTHSATMLMGLGRLVEKGVEDKRIAVYEVEKTESGSKYRRLKLNKNGFIEGWVQSYAEAESQLLDSWRKSVPEEPDTQ
jgi:predicted ATPase